MKKSNFNHKTFVIPFILLLFFPLIVFSMDVSTPVREQIIENLNTVITGEYILELNERVPVPRLTPYQSGGSPEDTINLMATIVRHKDNEKRPTILVVTPYRRWVFMAQGIYLFNHGYDIVAIDIRGTGSSEGEFLFMAPDEHFDVAYIIDQWIPSQPWSNGKIGMIGQSYNGIIQLLAASHVQIDESTGEPVHLKALLPMEPCSSAYVEGLKGGIPEFGFFSFWAGLHSFLSFMPPLLYMGEHDVIIPMYPDFKDASEMWLNNILSTPFEFHEWWFNPEMEYIGEWYYTRSPMIYWPEKPQGGWDLPKNLGETVIPEKLPVLIVAGWHDIFAKGSLDNYVHGLSRHADKDKALIVGPWYHASGVFDIYFYNIMMKIAPRWFDWKIKGIEDDFLVEYPVLLYVMGEEKWRAEKSWPLPESRTENKTYYLSKKRPPAVINDWFSSMNYFNNYSLKENVSSKDYNTLFNPDFIHDPLLLHGIKSRSFIRWMPFGVPALPAHFSKFVLNKNIDSTMPYEDERLDELGVLTFTTSVLEEDVEIVGPLKLTFWAKTEFPMPLTDAIKQAMVNEINKYYNFNEDTILLLDHPMRKDVQWVIEINDVYPGGRAKNITSGWLSAWHRPYDPNESPDVKDHQIDPNYVAFDPFYETPHKSPKPIEEGHIYPYVVEIWPTVNVFKAGHKIRVSISGSDFPHFIPNFRTSTNTLIIDQDHPARLEFSVANKQDEGNTWKWIDNIFEYLHKPAEEVKSGSVTGSLSTSFAGHEDIKVANAIVSFEDSNLTATTDSKGQFKFKNVPSGKKKVLFTAPGLESMAMTINVPENEMLTLVNIPKMTTESVIQKQFSESEINQLILDAATEERAKWDINGDRKKGIEEAIDALQQLVKDPNR